MEKSTSSQGPASDFRRSSSSRFYSAMMWLLPSFLQQSVIARSERQSDVLNETSYLNGFRGLMAFLVFVRHFTLPWQPDLDFGYLQGEQHDGILRLPGLRIFYAGPNVPVFLVVSGFVMSLKPLKLMRPGNWEALLKSSTSSVFRRAIRLFPPPIVSTLLVMLAVQLSLFDFPYGTMPGSIPRHPPHIHSFWKQLLDWTCFVMNELTNPWTWKAPTALYGAHLWTTPLQFRCSLVLILTLVGLARVRPPVQRYIAASMIAYCFAMRRWDVALYLSGMLMASNHLDHRAKSEGLPSWKPPRTSRIPRLLRISTVSLILSLGLYLSSFPRQAGVGPAPGYQIPYTLSHNYHTWHALGAIILVWGLGLSRSLQSAFNTPVLRYLGKISFSLYIVHEPMLHVFGFRCVELAWRLTGNAVPWRYQLGFVLGFVMTTPVVLWTADVFQRSVDEPCARFAAWVERKCSVATQ